MPLPGDSVVVENFGPAGASFLLCVSNTQQNVPVPPNGALLIGPSPILTLTGVTAYPGLSGPHTLPIPIPNNPLFRGLSLHFQSLAMTTTGLQSTNRASTLMH